MPASATPDEPTGREDLPEAFPSVFDARDTAADFRRVVSWQVSHRMEALLMARWRDGVLRVDHRHEKGVLLNMLFRELWLPTAVPPEGRDR